MGLDVALGIVILIAAIRGWIKGFVYQAIRLGGLVACVYLADPVRDQAKPHVVRYLSSVPPELIDRLLRWVAATVSYIILVGATSLVLKLTKRPEVPGLPSQRSRHDQFAGFLLGIAKGALVAAFLTAGIQMFALKQLEPFPWATNQARQSWALRWDNQYHPAEQIWRSPPVQHLVNHIRRMGCGYEDGAGNGVEKSGAPAEPVVQTASRDGVIRDGRAAVSVDDNASGPPAPPSVDTPTQRIDDPELEKTIAEVKAAVEAAARPR
ncbi:MAG: CvpA family protein [Isosphaeraceae bacterium]